MCKRCLLAPSKPVNHLMPSHLHRGLQISFISPVPVRAEIEVSFNGVSKIFAARTRMKPPKLSDFTAEAAWHFCGSFIILPCQKVIGLLAVWSVKQLLVGKNKQGRHPLFFTKNITGKNKIGNRFVLLKHGYSLNINCKCQLDTLVSFPLWVFNKRNKQISRVDTMSLQRRL